MKKLGLIVLLCAAMLTTQAAAPTNGTEATGGGEAPNNSGAADGSGTTDGSGITVLLNGQPLALAAPPLKKDGSVYVPLRGLLTALGATVDWNEQTGDVTASHNGNEVVIRSGSNQASVNGRSLTLDRPPFTLSGTTYVSVRWLNETFGAVVKWHAGTMTAAVYYPEDQLPSVGSLEHLQTLLADAAERQERMYGFARSGIIAFATADTTAAAPEAPQSKSMENESAAGSGSGGDHSTTNVQVQGVDEADVVKTDGDYIYQVNRQRILITSAKPADQMKTVAALKYADGDFMPQEIYVDDKRLIVIGSGNPPVDYARPAVEPLVPQSKKMIMPIAPYVQTTVAIVYDIADIAAPKEIRRLELEGGYLSSRKIGDSLYLVSNKYLYYHGIQPMDDGAEQDGSLAPLMRDSAVHDELTPIPYADIRYFPGFAEPNYMLVAGIDLGSPTEPMNVQTFLGSGQNVYASADHLYIAVTRYEAPEGDDAASPDASKRIAPAYGLNSTAVYKFALDPGGVVYMAEGKVPGTILNQFSMDEHQGHFRIATTSGDQWSSSGENQSKNNLYVLGDALQPVGKIEDIAPGERIYSVRFAGDRAYMVTFRTVDPLFVIDVADPASPRILGALKIPGYSDYLHPYDENHIIGFGKDTVEWTIKDEKGNTVGTNAYYLGMKIALFDVTDVANPKELHKVNIGDRGTHSELLYNHKALLFDKDKDLLAFPVDLYEVKDGARNEYNSPAYGTFTYQGAYVYKLNPEDGFQLRGRISHLTQDEITKAGNYGYGDKNVRRILYIGDMLYTLSDGMIKANAIGDLHDVGQLVLPTE